jgi:molybdopterin-guanine dinucleotide biosynthesis protein MobB
VVKVDIESAGSESWAALIGPRQVNIVGRRNHGKTLLVAELVAHLSALGFTVGSLKHSSHVHLLEDPDKDTARHRAAGAAPAAIVTPDLAAVFVTAPGGAVDSSLDRLVPMFRHCDLVVVEGFASARLPRKIEVWREEVHGEPLAAEWDDIVALVTDPSKAPNVAVRIWDRGDMAAIGAAVLDLVGLRAPAGH